MPEGGRQQHQWLRVVHHQEAMWWKLQVQNGKPRFGGLNLLYGESRGAREPRTIPTKDLAHEVVFWGGWCANCRNLRQRQNTHNPKFCTRDVDRQFCGGGAWISRSESPNWNYLGWPWGYSFPVSRANPCYMGENETHPKAH